MIAVSQISQLCLRLHLRTKGKQEPLFHTMIAMTRQLVVLYTLRAACDLIWYLF